MYVCVSQRPDINYDMIEQITSTLLFNDMPTSVTERDVCFKFNAVIVSCDTLLMMNELDILISVLSETNRDALLLSILPPPMKRCAW